MDKGIREIWEMPEEIKFYYGEILGTMLYEEDGIDPLKFTAFYQMMNKNKLPQLKRILLLKNLESRKDIMEEILEKSHKMEAILKDQEVNIFRFSLMKDLLILIKADYIVTEEEVELLDKIRSHFNISEEQFQFFEDEYEKDQGILKNEIHMTSIERLGKESIALGAALGIPLMTLRSSGRFKGVDRLGLVSGLRAMGHKKKTGRYDMAIGVAQAITMALATYKVVDALTDMAYKRRNKLDLLMKETVEKDHLQTLEILNEDRAYLEYKLKNLSKENSWEVEELKKKIQLLKKAALILQNMKPLVL